MIILVIGNGFDLAHGLPTKYTDFLKFAMVMHQVVDRGVPNDRIDYGKLTPAIVDLLKQNMHTLNMAEWKDLIYENLWIKYFLRNPMYAKENWIDFESEISKVIKQLDYDMFSTEGERCELTDVILNLSNDFLAQIYSRYTLTVQSINTLTSEKCESITFREIRDRLYDDLNKLTRALELYLTDFVEKIKCNLISPDIEIITKRIIELNEDHRGVIFSNVLSFNYTNTYERVYLNNKSLEKNIDYIHGKADSGHSIETNNMVLGIDEYLLDNRKNRDVEFIAFKKFFQRIYKGTGCKYKEWVDKIIEDASHYEGANKITLQRAVSGTMHRPGIIPNISKHIHYLYIFGHSLDVTDRDILRDLILNDNVYTTIYYLNKDIMRQQIANLVKVIGQDELIRRTGGSTKTIEFKLQQDMVEKNPAFA